MTRSVIRVPALSVPFDATVHLPGSKSHANRAIVCACLAPGLTRITGATPCDDVAVMVRGLQAMGYQLRWIDQSHGELEIRGGVPLCDNARATIDCHNAGTALRFLVSVAAVTPGLWTLTGNRHMLTRPIGDLVAALKMLGVDAEAANGCPPVRIRGGGLHGGSVVLDATVSSQFLTSVLLIAPVLPTGLTLTLSGRLASAGYVELTRRTMRDFGCEVHDDHGSFSVAPQMYRPLTSYRIEADWSAAGAWLALASLSNCTIDMPGLRDDSEQSDRHLPALLQTLQTSGDHEVDATETPDQVMNLAVFAACRSGTTTMRGLQNLRVKECDRLAVITSELRKAGVDIREVTDGIVVRGAGSPLALRRRGAAPVLLDPHGDHRMAMAFAILGLVRGGVAISDPGCVVKSYPSFFQDLQSAMSASRTIVIVGMRGVGKSSLGRRLASRLKLRYMDSDHLVEDRLREPLATFIAREGWDAFRRTEADIIRDALRPGIVLSLGGGALTTEATRSFLRGRAIIVWLQADLSQIVARLKRRARPALTSLPLEDEVRTVLAERTPQYREVATMTVSARVPFGRQVPLIQRELEAMLWQQSSTSFTC